MILDWVIYTAASSTALWEQWSLHDLQCRKGLLQYWEWYSLHIVTVWVHRLQQMLQSAQSLCELLSLSKFWPHHQSFFGLFFLLVFFLKFKETLDAGFMQTQHSFSEAVWLNERKEKQVMWDWRLKYFINQCCSQCVVWWLVENSGNPSFLPATDIQDSPQVLHVLPLFLYFQG